MQERKACDREETRSAPAWAFLVTTQRHFSPHSVYAPSVALGMNETLQVPSTEHPCKKAGCRREGRRDPVKIKTQKFLQDSTSSCEGDFFLLELQWIGNRICVLISMGNSPAFFLSQLKPRLLTWSVLSTGCFEPVSPPPKLCEEWHRSCEEWLCHNRVSQKSSSEASDGGEERDI